MNVYFFIKALNDLGATYELGETYSDDWLRVFIVIKGTQAGRATFQCNELKYLKQYKYSKECCFFNSLHETIKEFGVEI